MKHALDAKRSNRKVISKMVTNRERDEDAMRSRLRFSAFDKFWSGVLSVRDVQKSSIDPEFQSMFDKKDALVDPTIFLPHNGYKIAWDIFLGVIIMYSVVMVPFQIGFQIQFGHEMFVLEQVINSFFFTDILLTFNTAIVDHQGKLVFDRKIIATKYFYLWFWIDLISTFPFGTLSGGFGTLELARLFRLMRLLKLVRLLKLSKLGKQFDSLQINPALISIGNLIMQLLLVSHLMACFWFFITTDAVTQADETWVTHVDMQHAALLDKYVASFYWCITTILSIGYGDIVPVNSGERVFCICAELTGGIIFGAVISQVTRLIETRNPQAKAFKAKMDELKAYLGEKSLPRHLKTKAKNAYTYYLIRKSSFAESGIFDDLPKDMLGKLVNNIYGKEINGIQMFHAYNQRFVIQMVMHSQPSQAVQGDVICNCGDLADELIFLLHGVVRISVLRDGMHTVIAGYGSDTGYVGDFEFHKKSTRIADYTAILSCSIITIPFDVITDMATEHADSFDQFEDEIKGRYERFMDVNNLQFCKKRNKSQSSRLQEMIRGVHSNEPMKPDVQDQMFEFESMWIDGQIQKTDTRFSQAELSKVLSHLAVKSYRVLVYIPPTTPMGKHTTSLIDLNQQDFNDRRIIHPAHWAKTTWDFIIGLLIVYSVLTVPVQIAFGLEGNATLDWVFIGFFFVDMCFGFRTAYHDEEEDAYVVLPSLIYSRYLRSWFIIDFVSFFPFSYVLNYLLSSTSAGLSSIKLLKTVRLIRLVRLVRLAKLGHYLAKIEDQIGLSPAVFNLLNMLMQVLFIAHMVACVWWGMSSTMAERGWMDNVLEREGGGDNVRIATVEEQYIVALYWTTTTLATVGYGDITSTNTYERLLNIIIMILGATIFGYIVANVSNQMNSMNQASARLMERVTEVVEYLNEKNCPKYLSNSIIRHFKNKFNEQSVFDEVQILGRLPLRLHHEIRLFQHKEILSKIPIFKLLKNKSIIIYVFNMLDMSYYEPGQYLIRQNELGNDLCFLTDGTAHVYQKVIVQKKYNQTTKRTAKPTRFVKRQGSIIGSVAPAEPTEQQNISVIRTFTNMMTTDDSSIVEKRLMGSEETAELTSSKKKVTVWESYVNMEDNIARRGGKYLGNLNSGDFVGHVALMTQSRHAASVCASTACTVYLLSRSDVGKVCYEQKDVALQLQAALGKAVRNLEDTLGKNHVRIKRAAGLFKLRKGYFNHIGEEKEKKRRRVAVNQQSKGYLIHSSSKASSILKHAVSGPLVDLRLSQKDQESPQQHSWFGYSGYVAGGVDMNISAQPSDPSQRSFCMRLLAWLRCGFYWVLLKLHVINDRVYRIKTAGNRIQPENPSIDRQNRILTPEEKKMLRPPMRRWNLIREVILNAKAEAVVMRMKEANRRAQTDLILGTQTVTQEDYGFPFAPVETQLNHNSRDVDYFIRALRSRVGMVASGMGAAFHDHNLAYDSDVDLRQFDEITQGVQGMRRCASSPWLVPLEAPVLSSKRKIALLNTMQNRVAQPASTERIVLKNHTLPENQESSDQFITKIEQNTTTLHPNTLSLKSINSAKQLGEEEESKSKDNETPRFIATSVSSDEHADAEPAVPIFLNAATPNAKTIFSSQSQMSVSKSVEKTESDEQMSFSIHLASQRSPLPTNTGITDSITNTDADGVSTELMNSVERRKYEKAEAKLKHKLQQERVLEEKINEAKQKATAEYAVEMTKKQAMNVNVVSLEDNEGKVEETDKEGQQEQVVGGDGVNDGNDGVDALVSSNRVVSSTIALGGSYGSNVQEALSIRTQSLTPPPLAKREVSFQRQLNDSSEQSPGQVNDKEYGFARRASRQRRYSFPATNVSIHWKAEYKDQLVI